MKSLDSTNDRPQASGRSVTERFGADTNSLATLALIHQGQFALLPVLDSDSQPNTAAFWRYVIKA